MRVLDNVNANVLVELLDRWHRVGWLMVDGSHLELKVVRLEIGQLSNRCRCTIL